VNLVDLSTTAVLSLSFEGIVNKILLNTDNNLVVIGNYRASIYDSHMVCVLVSGICDPEVSFAGSIDTFEIVTKSLYVFGGTFFSFFSLSTVRILLYSNKDIKNAFKYDEFGCKCNFSEL
jgi:hypothetical protein